MSEKHGIISSMEQCYNVSFLTPKGVQLHGLWFGPEKAKNVLIIIHGLGSTMFSNHNLFLPLINAETAVFFFNNRGHDTITRSSKIDRRRKKGFKSFVAGAAHEVFTDCIDDIAGAIDFVQQQTKADIFLVGHSTGCQKSVYYEYKKKDNCLTGLILLSPVSDYADFKKYTPPEDQTNLQKIARTLVNQGNPHTLLPQSVWSSLADAQRFLSLYTPYSPEEVFPYSHDRKPKELQSIKTPILVILAEKDEFRDRPIKKIAAWFDKTIKSDHTITVIKNANHSFTENANEVGENIKEFMMF